MMINTIIYNSILRNNEIYAQIWVTFSVMNVKWWYI
jgi:hypothetical protein